MSDVTVPLNTRFAVTFTALQDVLLALNGPGHYIRELQVTRSLHGLGVTVNPIEQLVEQFEMHRKAHSEFAQHCVRDERFDAQIEASMSDLETLEMASLVERLVLSQEIATKCLDEFARSEKVAEASQKETATHEPT
ncbi:hypothetical protein [Paraburkholderia sp. BCC1886]|uniref:hypothetical protein n=1 Tax=Paraburkholderia sp. BCC1886 TaxID=2562670 RepID=UPI0011822F6B|nr:hypothetical protein [Paraburkholderia sp. BCC1886]